MEIVIEFETDGEAFKDDFDAEVGRVLMSVGKSALMGWSEQQPGETSPIVNADGNCIGSVTCERIGPAREER